MLKNGLHVQRWNLRTGLFVYYHITVPPAADRSGQGLDRTAEVAPDALGDRRWFDRSLPVPGVLRVALHPLPEFLVLPPALCKGRSEMRGAIRPVASISCLFIFIRCRWSPVTKSVCCERTWGRIKQAPKQCREAVDAGRTTTEEIR